MSGLLCSGNVNIAILDDDGSFKGFMPVKNTVELKFTQGDSNEKTRVSKMKGDFGQALDTVFSPGADSLSISIDENDADVAGMAFRGTVAKVDVAAGTSQTAVVDVFAGLYVPISATAYNLTNVTVKDPDDPDTTFILGVDYDLDAESGMIRKLAGGQLGEKASVSFSYPAYSAMEVSPGVKQTINLRIIGRMKNLANGKDIFVNVPKVAAYPTSEVDWFSEDFVVTQLGGKIQSVNGQKPYTVRYVQ